MIRTKKLLLETKPIYRDISMAAAAVWNQCLTLMDFYQYQRGYPHAHRDFYQTPRFQSPILQVGDVEIATALLLETDAGRDKNNKQIENVDFFR